ncbi:hypothetical protein C8R46DRAFT_1233201 [Mycena filopes]|nr:hypothetical protein C8R46DRAFT_1233201 [Mycena filopes]
MSSVDMSFVPPWSTLSLPPRGKTARLHLDIAQVLVNEFQITARKQNTPSSPLSDAHSIDLESPPLSPMSVDSDTASDSSQESCSDTSSETSETSAMALDSPDDDDEYIPPRTRKSALRAGSPYTLRSATTVQPHGPPATNAPILPPSAAPMPASAPTLDIALSPFPDTFMRGHLQALNFKFIRRDSELAAFVDEHDRVSAVYISSPVEALEWQRTVIQAGHDMLDARQTLHIDHIGPPRASMSAGFRCHGQAGPRPQNILGAMVSMEHIAIADLRMSPAIQAIASFQNAALRKLAPRAWSAANTIIEATLANDYGLRLPFDLPNQRPRQPTAFSQVEYRFWTDGVPRREATALPAGLSALTVVGDYHPTEGELILWEDQTVLNFPPGSTFLLPKWMHYSFTAVEAPGYQMVIVQSCDGELDDYVENDFHATVCGEADTDLESLQQRADIEADNYSRRDEYERGEDGVEIV